MYCGERVGSTDGAHGEWKGGGEWAALTEHVWKCWSGELAGSTDGTSGSGKEAGTTVGGGRAALTECMVRESTDRREQAEHVGRCCRMDRGWAALMEHMEWK